MWPSDLEAEKRSLRRAVVMRLADYLEMADRLSAKLRDRVSPDPQRACFWAGDTRIAWADARTIVSGGAV